MPLKNRSAENPHPEGGIAKSAVDAEPVPIFAPREGYNLAARIFEEWPWTTFWRTYESPIVKRWIQTQHVSVACDLGCGIGTYTSLLARQSTFCVGVDISEAMLAHARKRTRPFHNVLLAQGSLLRLPLASNSLHAVVCSRTIAHISDLQALFRELGRVTTSGTNLLITDVHPDHPYEVTRVRASKTSIRIETHKHPISKILNALQTIGFPHPELCEFRLSDLIPPPDSTVFAKLYNAGDPMIFYAITAARL